MKRIISLVLVAVLVLSVPMMASPAKAAAYTGLMRQYESQWANIYHNGGSLYNCGCGLFSLANAVGYLTGYQMDVVELANWAHANGMYNVTGADGTYRTSFYPAASNRYGSTYGFTIDCGSGSGYWSTASDSRLKNHLIAGGVAIVHVYNHFICIVGYDTSSGLYHLYESAPDPYRGTNYNGGDVWFSESQLCSGYTDVDWFCLISATNGWKKNSTGWWYEYADGSYAVGWAKIGGSWYYFDQNGYMQTGWLYDEDYEAWFYLSSSGAMITGWLYLDECYYYMDSSGKMQLGWQEIDGYRYYFNTTDQLPKGVMYTGWQEIDGKQYYFSEVEDSTMGAMTIGWYYDGSNWYYFGEDGAMLYGWQEIDGSWYHLDETTGVMASYRWVTKDGVRQYVEYGGAAIDGAVWDGEYEDALDIGTDFYATIDIPYTGTRAGVDSDSSSDTYKNVEVQAVRAEDASDYNEQLWHFQRREDDGSYRITNVATGMCLDQADGDITAGTNVRVWADNDAMAQRWFVFANGDNYGFVSACSVWDMTVLDVQDNQGTEGTNIRIWSQNTSGAQKFAVTPISEPADPEPLPTISLQYPTLLLEDEIKMNVFFTLDQDIPLENMGMLTWTSKPSVVDISTADAVIPGGTYNSDLGFYGVATAGIPAQNLGDTIYFCIYVELADGSIVYGKQVQYSPTTYAYNQLNGSADAATKALYVAILNYGSAAQTFLADTDSLVNANLTNAQKALVEEYNSNMVHSVAMPNATKQGALAANGGFSSKRPTISLDSAFAINYFFTPSAEVAGDMTFYYWNAADFAANSVLTTKNATGSTAMVLEDDAYGAAIEGIAAKDIDGALYACGVYTDVDGNTYSTGILPYSLGFYCGNTAKGEGTLADLAAAIAVYGYYASNYFA